MFKTRALCLLSVNLELRKVGMALTWCQMMRRAQEVVVGGVRGDMDEFLAKAILIRDKNGDW